MPLTPDEARDRMNMHKSASEQKKKPKGGKGSNQYKAKGSSRQRSFEQSAKLAKGIGHRRMKAQQEWHKPQNEQSEKHKNRSDNYDAMYNRAAKEVIDKGTLRSKLALTPKKKIKVENAKSRRN